MSSGWLSQLLDLAKAAPVQAKKRVCTGCGRSEPEVEFYRREGGKEEAKCKVCISRARIQFRIRRAKAAGKVFKPKARPLLENQK